MNAKALLVYADTSVYGGVFDDEFDGVWGGLECWLLCYLVIGLLVIFFKHLLCEDEFFFRHCEGGVVSTLELLKQSLFRKDLMMLRLLLPIVIGIAMTVGKRALSEVNDY